MATGVIACRWYGSKTHCAALLRRTLSARKPSEIDEALEALQRHTFGYFLRETNAENGLVADNTREDAVSSIAATGLGLAAYPVGVERGFITRRDAVDRTLTTLRFFRESAQGPDPDATGYRGFYYHFLDMQKGTRVWDCELSAMDTALFIAGALTCMMYFDGDGDGEREIRRLAAFLYQRVDWAWALNEGPTVAMGWKPAVGFLRYGWEGYSEATLLYVLGLGSPEHPIPPRSYVAWTSTYQWENIYGYDLLVAAPLFIHQLAHAWIDFRGIEDAFMREKGSDYFENSRRATYVQRQYAIRNPLRFRGYGENCWGITAGDGPGFSTQRVDGIQRRFFGYVARGIPYGPDDGTIAPWAAVVSLPFAPEIVLPALRHCLKTYPDIAATDGSIRSFNPTFPTSTATHRGWVCETQYGLDQGPVVLMIENHRSGLLWRLMRECPPIVAGLRRAGFRGGWLRGFGR
jgi:hypothetical protein